MVPPCYSTLPQKGYSMVKEYLLENGANPNLADQFGVIPLIAATMKATAEVSRLGIGGEK